MLWRLLFLASLLTVAHLALESISSDEPDEIIEPPEAIRIRSNLRQDGSDLHLFHKEKITDRSPRKLSTLNKIILALTDYVDIKDEDSVRIEEGQNADPFQYHQQ